MILGVIWRGNRGDEGTIQQILILLPEIFIF